MAVSFSHITSSIRVPLFYAELDASRAGLFQRSLRTLLIGLKSDDAGATAAANSLVQVTSGDQADRIFGVGSQLATMVRVYKQNDPFTELWCCPVTQTGTVLSKTVTFATNASSAGTFSFSAGSVPISISVTNGQTPTASATALAAAINARKGSGFSAAATAGVVTVSTIGKGVIYTEEEMAFVRTTLPTAVPPSAQTVTLGSATAATGTTPALTDTIAAMGESVFDAVVCGFHDETSLNALKTEHNESAGRWSYLRQLYGHVFTAAKDATLADLSSIGEATTRNNPHETILGIPGHATRVYSPTPSWLWATAAAAQTIKSASSDPARPLQTLPLEGCTLDERAAHSISEQNVLLYDGMSTVNVTAGSARISRLVTTYRQNPAGDTDTSYLDVTTLYTLAHILRFLRNRITTKYARYKLANDGTRFGEGQAIVTPQILRSELVAGYAQLEAEGLVENRDLFIQNLVVERDRNDPNRVNVLYPPDLVNQLRIFAVVAQFRLQYEDALIEESGGETEDES